MEDKDQYQKNIDHLPNELLIEVLRHSAQDADLLPWNHRSAAIFGVPEIQDALSQSRQKALHAITQIRQRVSEFIDDTNPLNLFDFDTLTPLFEPVLENHAALFTTVKAFLRETEALFGGREYRASEIINALISTGASPSTLLVLFNHFRRIGKPLKICKVEGLTNILSPVDDETDARLFELLYHTAPFPEPYFRRMFFFNTMCSLCLRNGWRGCLAFYKKYHDEFDDTDENDVVMRVWIAVLSGSVQLFHHIVPRNYFHREERGSDWPRPGPSVLPPVGSSEMTKFLSNNGVRIPGPSDVIEMWVDRAGVLKMSMYPYIASTTWMPKFIERALSTSDTNFEKYYVNFKEDLEWARERGTFPFNTAFVDMRVLLEVVKNREILADYRAEHDKGRLQALGVDDENIERWAKEIQDTKSMEDSTALQLLGLDQDTIDFWSGPAESEPELDDWGDIIRPAGNDPGSDSGSDDYDYDY